MEKQKFKWDQLHNFFYNKEEVYKLEWDDQEIDLKDYEIAAAPNGGPVAMIRSRGKIVRYQEKSVLKIFNASGSLLEEIPWDNEDVLSTFGWKTNDELVCILEDCKVKIFNLRGTLTREIHVGYNTLERKKEQKKIDERNALMLNGEGEGDLSVLIGDKQGKRKTNSRGIERILDSEEEKLEKEKEKKEQEEKGRTNKNDIGNSEEEEDEKFDSKKIKLLVDPNEEIRGLDEVLIPTVTCAKIWQTGFAILTDLQELFVCKDWDQTYQKYPKLDFGDTPLSMAVIESQFSSTGDIEILFGTKKNQIFMIDSIENQSQEVKSNVVELSVASSGKILAYYTQDGKVIVEPTNFSKVLVEYQTDVFERPTQLVWCSSDSVLVYWENQKILKMIGPNNSTIDYPIEDYKKIFLAPEVDGVRVYYNDKTEFISKVPMYTYNIFSIESVGASWTLYNAYEKFIIGDSQADVEIRSLGNELGNAIEDCILAAGNESDPMDQQKLLKAASLGKAYDHQYEYPKFAEMCRDLRILNAVRDFEVGIPITYNQFMRFGIEPLILRLVNYLHHFLAFKICKYSKIRPETVLEDWACSMIIYKSITEQNRLEKVILGKLDTHRKEGGIVVSYANIARVAFERGHKELAKKLLFQEPKPQNQVPLLIAMKNDREALKKAVQSGDADLIFTVLLHLIDTIKYERSRMNSSSFMRLISNSETAQSLLVRYSRRKETRVLKNVFQSLGQMKKLGLYVAWRSFYMKDPNQRIESLLEAQSSFQSAQNNLYKKITEDQIKLLQLQLSYEQEKSNESQRSMSFEYFGLSVSDTLSLLIERGEKKYADKLKKDFKIPDKRFWWLKIKALAKVRKFDDLHEFAKQKSPIGYEPFVQVCLDNTAHNQAIEFVEKIPSLEKRSEHYIKLESWENAAKMAMELRDQELLDHIHEIAPSDVKIPMRVPQAPKKRGFFSKKK
ncbi:vacuolar protein sorting vps16 [Anaeramoeba flamelloides]|uniref:Vacuolar protein sorting vps16 n=1 Tax=Anaeramoeba flamelloides TaxID=1746091 RepID=A0ABQ8XZ93_9EUKA|nr:vacuolar protein sorting vps16 [Anaeramoeba flamelloides]